MIKIRQLHKSFDQTPVLKGIDITVEKGEVVVIIGPSGSGKSTFLRCLNLLETPTEGTIEFEGTNILAKDHNIDELRQKMGMVFQSFNLITKLTAFENVILSMDISGKKIANKKEEAYKLLKSVGLDKDEANRRVLKLSGGQQQRVAIARTLSYDPDIILADEPTGNLDSETQNEIMTILRELAKKGKCVILVTHSPEVAKMSDYVYELAPKKVSTRSNTLLPPLGSRNSL